MTVSGFLSFPSLKKCLLSPVSQLFYSSQSSCGSSRSEVVFKALALRSGLYFSYVVQLMAVVDWPQESPNLDRLILKKDTEKRTLLQLWRLRCE